MYIDKIRITFKILILFGLFVVLALGSTWFSTGRMRNIDDAYSAAIDEEAKVAIFLARANRSFQMMRAEISGLLVANDGDGAKRASESIKLARAAFAEQIGKARAADPHDQFQIDEIGTAGLAVLDNVCAKASQMALAAKDASSAEAARQEYLRTCQPSFQEFTSKITHAVDLAIAALDKRSDDLTETTNQTIHITSGVMLGGLALVMALAWMGARRWIARPIASLTSAMGRIAEGELSTSVPGANRGDEIGRMAKTVEIFKANGLKLRASEEEAARNRSSAEAERTRVEAERATAARELATVVDSIGKGLDQLAAGTLTFRLNQSFARDYEKLRVDFNGAMEKLASAMIAVAGNTAAIRFGSNEISTAATDLSRRTEQQAASLEETAAALDEITATVRKTSEGASHARKVVSEAKTDAEHSGAIVGKAVQAMTAIEKSSQQISQIIGVIDEIAFQTNLLALNAGVEAARAGDAGKGFAVVASEVRGLAQRSAEAAKEIKALISTSSGQVADGVTLVGETGKALGRIVTQVGEINAIVSDIAASAQEQAAGLEQVNTAINQMDQVTQQNASMVEESTAASQNLRQESEELARLVGNFHTGQHQGASASVSGHSHRPTTTKPVTVAALKTIGRGGAARKPDPAGSADSWEEF